MNVVGINSGTKEVAGIQPGFLTIHYTDGTQELLQVDSFGVAEEMPGFLTLWSDSIDGPVGFLNRNTIKKIIPVETVDLDERL